MSSINLNTYKSEWKNLWKNEEISKLDKISIRMQFDNVLECQDDKIEENLRKFFTRNVKYFPKINKNLNDVIESELFSSGFFSNKISFFNRIKISYFFKYVLKEDIFYTIFGFLFGIFFIWILEVPESVLVNYISLDLINAGIIFYTIFVLISDFLLYRGKYDDKGLAHNEKVKNICQKILFIISLLSRIIFWVGFFYLFYLASTGLVWELASEFGIALFQYLILTLFYLVIVDVIRMLAIYYISFEKKFLYYMLRFIISLKNSHENNLSTIPFLFHKFLNSFNKKVNRCLNLKIENIDEIEMSFNSKFINENSEIFEGLANNLQKEILNSEKNIKFYINLNYSLIKKIIIQLENTFDVIKLPKLKFIRIKFGELTFRKYKKIINIIIAITVVISGIINIIIRFI